MPKGKEKGFSLIPRTAPGVNGKPFSSLWVFRAATETSEKAEKRAENPIRVKVLLQKTNADGRSTELC